MEASERNPSQMLVSEGPHFQRAASLGTPTHRVNPQVQWNIQEVDDQWARRWPLWAWPQRQSTGVRPEWAALPLNATTATFILI